MIAQSRTGIRNGYAVRENGYRFTFNGMEKDDEVKGVGNSLDFGARIYDSRTGRFLSRDPLEFKYSAISPYVFVGNNPINAIDPDGREIKYVIRDKNGNPTNVLTYRNSNFWYANGDRYNPGKESLDITLFKTLSVFRKIEKSGDNV